jgi:hypothetical protein
VILYLLADVKSSRGYSGDVVQQFATETGNKGMNLQDPILQVFHVCITKRKSKYNQVLIFNIILVEGTYKLQSLII